jgi:MYXO-CTERM domain-containing protein
MRLAPALVLALAPFAAGALTFNVNGSNADVLVGVSNCTTLQLLASWDLQTAPFSGDSVRLLGVRNASSCTSNPPSPAAEITRSEPVAQTGSDTISANQLALADGGTAGCGDPAIQAATSANPATNLLCLQWISGGTLTQASVNVKYALAKPTPPQGVSIGAGDSHLRVSWSAGNSAETIAKYDVHVVPQGTTSDGGVADTVTVTNADVDHTDNGSPLQNDAGYTVTVVARDTYGNVSDPSNPVNATPLYSADFYAHYRDEGGSALGGHGCATGSAPAWIAAVAIALALLLRRRRRPPNGAALIALLALAGAAARAEERPPRRFLVGFKIDRYDPKVDSEPGLTGTPYHDVFGPRAPPRYQLEFDWEVAHPFGSLLVGATAGFWQNYGKAIVPGSTPIRQSQDSVTLNVFPFGLIATYRFDWLADRWERFPFIPYLQAGLMRALWVSYNGRGGVSGNPTRGGRGSGWTNGYTTALGIAVNLNAVDLALAREAYVDTGIQRTSLFAEYGWTYLSDFHRGGALILSDHAWRFGVAVEF